MLATVWLVVLTALRNRLFAGVFAALIGATALSVFLGGTALIEQALAQQPRGEARLLGPVETWDLGNEVPRRKVIGLKDPDGMHIDIYQPERQFIASVPV